MSKILPEHYILRELERAKEKHLPKAALTDWERNVLPEFKGLSNEQIKHKISDRLLPFAFLMTNLSIDYNLGAVVRVANALGGGVFYYGERKFDRRGATGTYNYTPTHHLKTIEEVAKLKEEYEFVGLEQTSSSISLPVFPWTRERKTMIVIGEEAVGLQGHPEVMELMDYFVEIPQRGSVPSMNAATAASIAAYDYTLKVHYQ